MIDSTKNKNSTFSLYKLGKRWNSSSLKRKLFNLPRIVRFEQLGERVVFFLG